MKILSLKTVLLSIIMVPLFSFIVDAEEIINPFGGIKWSDSVFEVIKKVNDRKGLESSEIQIIVGRISTKENISKITSDTEINALMSKIVKDYEGDKSFCEYNDGNGLKPTLSEKVIDEMCYGEIEIKASPIIIADVPFLLIIKFKPSIGYLVKFKDKLTRFKGNKGEFYLPYYIQEVILRGKQFRDEIPEEMKNEVKEVVFNKYENMLSDVCKQNGKIVCKEYYEDIHGKTQLTIRDTSNYFEIVYNNTYMCEELNKIYQNYLRTLAKEKYKDHKDASGDL